jgi:Flp pilus assembly protein TadG
MKALTLVRRFLGARAGSAAVEFAIIVPVMIAMTAGAVELGRAFQAYNAANRLATQYAFTWSDCTDSPVGTCLTELNAFTASSSLANIVPQLITNNIGLRMFQVTVAGSNVNVVYAYPSGQTLTSAEQTAATTTLTNGQTGVVVSVNYVHYLIAFANLMSSVIGPSYTMTFTVVQVKA